MLEVEQLPPRTRSTIQNTAKNVDHDKFFSCKCRKKKSNNAALAVEFCVAKDIPPLHIVEKVGFNSKLFLLK